MSIRIKKELCTGCGKCREVCPGTLLFKDQESNKTYIKYPEECWGCTSCLKECGQKAITYYLGADIGGNGTAMYVVEKGKELHWHISAQEGDEKIIIINKMKANSY